MTRGLGLQQIRQFLSLLPTSKLRPLNKMRERKLQTCMPSRLQRAESERERLRRALGSRHWQMLLRMTHSKTSTKVTHLFREIGNCRNAENVVSALWSTFAKWIAEGGQYSRRNEAYALLEQACPKRHKTGRYAGNTKCLITTGAGATSPL